MSEHELYKPSDLVYTDLIIDISLKGYIDSNLKESARL